MKCEICGKEFRFPVQLERHVESEHPEIGRVKYFGKYLLKEPDEKYGYCLVCGKPLEINGRKFSFKHKNGFRCHVHAGKCNARTKENMIKMYGEEEGLRRWNHYCELQSITNTFEYKQQKYGWSKEQFDKFNKSRAVTLENMINKYGKEEGEKKFKNYCEIQKYVGCKLEYFVEKYGQEEGEKKYYDMIDRKAHTLENFIRKYGKEEGTIKYNDYVKNNHCFFSKISKELFDTLQKKLPNRKFKYADYEYGIYDSVNKKLNKYDFTDIKNKLIIEFNGEHFHAKTKDDPSFFNPFLPNLTAEEQWQLDENKKLCAERNGYKIYYIWEKEYKDNKNAVIEKCLKFLKENTCNF